MRPEKKKSKFNKTSYIWIVTAISILVSIVVFGISSNLFGQSDSIASNLSEPYASYGGLQWSLENYRITPPNNDDVRTLILEISVFNSLNDINILVPKQMVFLSSGQKKINLHRFANSDSTDYLYLKPRQVKSVSLPFKLQSKKFNSDNWELRVQETIGKVPAIIPLSGETLDDTLPLDVIKNNNNKQGINFVKASKSYNFISDRSSIGEAYYQVEVENSGTEDSLFKSEDLWSLRDGSKINKPVKISESANNNGAINVTFLADDESDEFDLLFNKAHIVTFENKKFVIE